MQKLLKSDTISYDDEGRSMKLILCLRKWYKIKNIQEHVKHNASYGIGKCFTKYLTFIYKEQFRSQKGNSEYFIFINNS